MGIIATVAIDLWALVVKHGFKQQTTDWGMAGRWFAYLPRGVFIHQPIGKSEAVKNEKLIGWSVHYAIGVIYAGLYIILVTDLLSAQPALSNAVVFGIATVVAPWFLMQPGMGMGVLACKTPNPNIKRLISLSMHAIFGIGLYAGWMLAQSTV